MNDAIETFLRKSNRIAQDILDAVRLLPKTKANQAAEDRLLLAWKDIRALVEEVRIKELGE